MLAVFFILSGVGLFSASGIGISFGDCVALPKTEIGYSIQSSHMVAPGHSPRKGVPNYLDRISAFSSVFSAFESLSRLSRKTDVLLNAFIVLPHIFNHIAGLAVQQITDRFQRSPRHHLSASYLLEH